MLSMIQELMQHKAWANATLLRAIEQHPAAANDNELHKMLHHILVANRFWLLAVLGHPFEREREMLIPQNLTAIIDRFSETERLEAD